MTDSGDHNDLLNFSHDNDAFAGEEVISLQ